MATGYGADGLYVFGNSDSPGYGCKIVHPLPDGQRDHYAFDACVLWEVTQLWAQGIKTACSCCGHGQWAPYIGVEDEASIERMIEMGYEACEPAYEFCTACCGRFFRAKNKTMCELEGQSYV